MTGCFVITCLSVTVLWSAKVKLLDTDDNQATLGYYAELLLGPIAYFWLIALIISVCINLLNIQAADVVLLETAVPTKRNAGRAIPPIPPSLPHSVGPTGLFYFESSGFCGGQEGEDWGED